MGGSINDPLYLKKGRKRRPPHCWSPQLALGDPDRDAQSNIQDIQAASKEIRAFVTPEAPQALSAVPATVHQNEICTSLRAGAHAQECSKPQDEKNILENQFNTLDLLKQLFIEYLLCPEHVCHLIYSSKWPHEMGTSNCLHFQRSKLRPRKVKDVASGLHKK